MTRKNLLQFDSSPRGRNEAEEAYVQSSVSTENKYDPSGDIPANPVSRALRGIEVKAARSNEYDEKIAAGLVIYELDHSLIDFSFIKDRIDLEQTAIDELQSKIAEAGQNSPILVRPHPVDTGRYQIVFGHRRYLATKALGVKVKAIIRSVEDRDLIIAQGQENNDHVGLSFIERSQFALKIRSLGYDMNVVMQAINANQSLAYKMIGIAEKVGLNLISVIGPAPTIGRRKWEELADQIVGVELDAFTFITTSENQNYNSDKRFELLLKFLAETKLSDTASRSTAVEKLKSTAAKQWMSPNGDLIIETKTNTKSFDITLKKPQSHTFGIWLTSKLDQLYGEYEVEKQKE